jgi:hypothetical protein
LIVENVRIWFAQPASLGHTQSILDCLHPRGDDKPYKYPGMYRADDNHQQGRSAALRSI